MIRLSLRAVGRMAAAFFVVGLLTACPDSAVDAQRGPRPLAPDFDLVLLDGHPVRLEDLRGKIVVLDFWATWCAPCEIQMPILDAIWRDHLEQQAGGAGEKSGSKGAEIGAGNRLNGGDDLMIVGLSVDTDSSAKVAAWVRERDFEYPIAIADQELAMRFGVIGFPTLLVIDPDGGIHTRHTGVLSRPEIESILSEIRLAAQSEAGS